ncbi:MAG: hypothetical protein H0A75_04605 [Candidatus Methanofishera endochildressiae]|uniref:Uncharacterized protein n=1 Tax=Candidatus Methanofishera endochildressiae TaxID=2738884 RepID=A0A7Z0MNP2_9GAMM|nr:hypothetical protein [Candidatus Methanofishera endochildressiae]
MVIPTQDIRSTKVITTHFGYYYGSGFGRGLYNRPTGFGGGGPTEPPDPRPALPVNKAK